jgi:hypothetical protein
LCKSVRKLGVTLSDPLPDGFLDDLAVRVRRATGLTATDRFLFGCCAMELERAGQRGRRLA